MIIIDNHVQKVGKQKNFTHKKKESNKTNNQEIEKPTTTEFITEDKI